MHKQKRISILPTLFLTLYMLFSPVSGSLADVVIDDGDPGTSSTGGGISGGSTPWDPNAPEAVSLWSRNGATYSWTFTPTDTGNHEISMWWTGWSSRSANIPVSNHHAGGTDTVSVNQQINAGRRCSVRPRCHRESIRFVSGCGMTRGPGLPLPEPWRSSGIATVPLPSCRLGIRSHWDLAKRHTSMGWAVTGSTSKPTVANGML